MPFPDKPIAQLLGSSGPIHAVAYSASPGTYILSGSADRAIRLHNPSSTTRPTTTTSYITPSTASIVSRPPIPQGRLVQTFTGHGYPVLAVAVASDNARFVSAGGDRAPFLWDVATATTVRRFAGGGVHGHSSRVNCVAFGGTDDSLVISGGDDCSVRIWDTRSGVGKGDAVGSGVRPVQTLSEARDAVTALIVRDTEVVAGSVDGRIRAYDVRMGQVTTDVVGASVTSLALTRDGKTMLVSSLDSRIRLMDRDNGACLRTYADAAWRNQDLRIQSTLGSNDRYVVAGDEMASAAGETKSGGGEGRVWAWDLLSGKLVAKVAVPWGPDSPGKQRRAIGQDGKAKVRQNVVSCIAWRDRGTGSQFCVSGTSGVVTVYGSM